MKSLLISLALVFVVVQSTAQQGISTTRTPDQPETYILSPGGAHPAQFATERLTLTGARLTMPASDPHFEIWMDWLAGCPKLQTLELDGNRMEILSPAITKLAGLQTVRISNNPLLHFDDACRKLQELPALKNLSVAGNALTKLPQSLGNLAQLETLTLGGEQQPDWQSAVTVLQALPRLHTLDVQVTDVTALPGCLAQLEQLQRVNFTIGKNGAADAPAYSDAFRVPVTATRSLQVKLDVIDGPLSFSEEATLLHMVQQMRVKQAHDAVAQNENASVSGFKRTYKGVSAPVPELDIRQTTYSISSISGGELAYKSGTVIRIPAEAFVDAAGNPIEGKVMIDYREFRDPLDFIMSGIPMTYDTAGKTETFESAGMFELNASVNGQEVFLAPGKKVDMAFASTDAASSFNLYSYNAVDGGWNMLDKAGKVDVDTNTRPAEMSGAWKLFKPRFVKIPPLRDTVSFDGRYASENYFYTRKLAVKADAGSTIEKLNWIQKLEKKISGGSRGTKMRYLVKLKRVSSPEKNKTCFKLDFDSDLLPELSAFNGTVFVIEGKMTFGDFNARYGSRMRFSDIRISLDGDQARLEMKSYKGYTSVDANLARIDWKDSLVSISGKALTSINKSYNHLLNSRRKGVTRSVSSELKQHNSAKAINTRASRQAWKRIQKYMSPEERAMTYEQWLSYYTRLTAPVDTRPEVIRYLSLTGFGIYNCDQVERLDQAIYAHASFIDQQGLNSRSNTTYVIDSRMNGVLTYTGNFNERNSANYFALDREASTVLMMMLADGKIGYVPAAGVDKARATANGNKFEFEMKTVDPKEVSLEELRSRMGL